MQEEGLMEISTTKNRPLLHRTIDNVNKVNASIAILNYWDESFYEAAIEI